MILVIDVGNTNITFGVYESKKLVTTFRMTSRTMRTSDEYGTEILAMLQNNQIDRRKVGGAIIASVVPKVMHALIGAVVRYLHTEPLIVGSGIKTGIKITSENPKEIGPDRIVDAVGAYELYGGPVIVMDFGTATTYDVILEDGVFTAGITSPGLASSARSLWCDAAKLPEIEIVKPKSILAKNTITSMQAGLVYGYIGQTEYIIKKIKEETGLTDIKTVATGGYGRLISGNTDSIQIYDNELTLKGLQLIYAKNQ